MTTPLDLTWVNDAAPALNAGNLQAVVDKLNEVRGVADTADGLAGSAVQPGDLATVATTGAYADLSGKPTLGTAASKDVGTAAGTVAAGDDSRMVNALLKTLADAKGDLLVATAADAIARLAVGTDGQVLTADSTTAAGVKWAAGGGGGGGTPGVWTAFSSFGTSVTAHDGSVYYTPRCRLSADGTKVELRGAIVVSAQMSSNGAMFTLPTGFRPASRVAGILATVNGSAHPAFYIGSDGIAKAGITVPAATYGLDGLSFVLS